MALSIRNPMVEEQVRQLAQETNESMTHAIAEAVNLRLRLVRAGRDQRPLEDRVAEIQRAAKRAYNGARQTEDELLGYAEMEGVE